MSGTITRPPSSGEPNGARRCSTGYFRSRRSRRARTWPLPSLLDLEIREPGVDRVAEGRNLLRGRGSNVIGSTGPAARASASISSKIACAILGVRCPGGHEPRAARQITAPRGVRRPLSFTWAYPSFVVRRLPSWSHQLAYWYGPERPRSRGIDTAARRRDSHVTLAGHDDQPLFRSFAAFSGRTIGRRCASCARLRASSVDGWP